KKKAEKPSGKKRSAPAKKAAPSKKAAPPPRAAKAVKKAAPAKKTAPAKKAAPPPRAAAPGKVAKVKPATVGESPSAFRVHEAQGPAEITGFASESSGFAPSTFEPPSRSTAATAAEVDGPLEQSQATMDLQESARRAALDRLFRN
ncbi:MAG: hypothetical protein ABW321_09755, partial [Polyangiales bacterium]